MGTCRKISLNTKMKEEMTSEPQSGDAARPAAPEIAGPGRTSPIAWRDLPTFTLSNHPRCDSPVQLHFNLHAATLPKYYKISTAFLARTCGVGLNHCKKHVENALFLSCAD